jgi:hypothetical protein
LPGCLIHCITPVAKQEQNVRPPWSVFCQCKIHKAMYQQRRCCENILPSNTRALGLQLTAFATTSVQFVSRSLTDESKSYEYLTTVSSLE